MYFLDKSLPEHFHRKSINDYPVVVVGRDQFIAEAEDTDHMQVCIVVDVKRVRDKVQVSFVSAYHRIMPKGVGSVGVNERLGQYLCKPVKKSLEVEISAVDPFFEFLKIKNGFPANSFTVPLTSKVLPLNEVLLRGTISAALKSAEADRPNVKKWGVVFVPDRSLSEDEKWKLLWESSKSGLSAARFIDPEE